MQEDQWREECIQMDVKTVAPFDVGIGVLQPEIFVGEEPGECGDDNASQDKVHQNDVEDAVNRLTERQIQGPCESDGRYWKEGRW